MTSNSAKQLEQKALLEEALGNANRANAAKSAFLLNMSHDIRTPMNAIVGFTTLASNHIDQTDKVEGYLEEFKASSDHLLNLINDILDMSRIEQGKVTLDESCCSLTTVFDDLYSMLQHEAASKGLSLSMDTSGVRHADVVCDRLKVNQVLLQPARQLPQVHERGRKRPRHRAGAPGLADRAWDVPHRGRGHGHRNVARLHRAGSSTRSSASARKTISGIQGSGLGMAIVKSLVDMMNGTVEVQSELGKGSRFVVKLTFRIAEAPQDSGYRVRRVRRRVHARTRGEVLASCWSTTTC